VTELSGAAERVLMEVAVRSAVTKAVVEEPAVAGAVVLASPVVLPGEET
jgi:hypothetical protein